MIDEREWREPAANDDASARQEAGCQTALLERCMVNDVDEDLPTQQAAAQEFVMSAEHDGLVWIGLVMTDLALAVLFWIIPLDVRLPHQAVVLALVSALVLSRQVIDERIVVIPTMGVQLVTRRGLRLTKARTYAVRSNVKLIPRDQIMDVFTKEAFLRWRIVDYLVIATRPHRQRQQSLHVVFPNVLPRLAVVRHVYRSVYPLIFSDAVKPAAPPSPAL